MEGPLKMGSNLQDSDINAGFAKINFKQVISIRLMQILPILP